MIQEWYEIKKLAGVGGLPITVQGLTKKAKLENWQRRRVNGVKGKVFEYYVGDMPKTVQDALGFRVVDQAISSLNEPTLPITQNGIIKRDTGNRELASNSTPSYKTLNMREFNKNVVTVYSYASINVSAGFGSFNEGVTEPDGEEPYSEGLLARLGVKPDNAAVFWADGDSMEPTIADGDQMLVDLSRNQLRGNSKIYLVQNGDSVWVKRIRKRWDGIELISDNSEIYEPIFIPASEAEHLQIIGQVVHIGHSFE